MRSLLPYSDIPSVRERIDELFSRQMLGAVLVGKFVGDYAALLSVNTLGIDIGYSLGIAITISLFIYWDRVANRAKQAQEGLAGQSKLSRFIEEEN